MDTHFKSMRIGVFAVYDGEDRLSPFFLLEKTAHKERFHYIAKYKTPVVKRTLKTVGENTTRRMQKW